MDNQTINDFHPIFLGTSMILPNFYEKHCYYCHTEEQHGCDTLTTSLHLGSVSNKPPRPASLFQRAAPAPNGEKLRCPLWKINKEKKSKKEGQNCRENEICQLESTSGVQKYCEQQYQHIIILLAYSTHKLAINAGEKRFLSHRILKKEHRVLSHLLWSWFMKGESCELVLKWYTMSFAYSFASSLAKSGADPICD